MSMDDLGPLLRGEYEARRTAPGGIAAQDLFASARRGTARKRAQRAFTNSAVAVLAVGVAGLGSWGLLNARTEVGPAATASVTASVTATSAPSDPPPPTPAPVPEPTIPTNLDATYFAGTSELPAAPAVNDDVWARVDGEWTLALYTFGAPWDQGVQTQAIYLIEPDGTFYMVSELVGEFDRIKRWRFDEREVVLGGTGGRSSIDTTLNLDTGAMTERVVGELMPTFFRVSPSGREVWYVYNGPGDPFVEMYDPATGTYDTTNTEGFSAYQQPSPDSGQRQFVPIPLPDGSAPTGDIGVWSWVRFSQGFAQQ